MIKKIINYSTYLLIILILFLKAPQIFQNFKTEGEQFIFNLPVYISANQITNSNTKNTIVVFWATWCGPCSVELKKINQLILDKEIDPMSVIAISIEDDFEIVKDHILKNNFQFKWALDSMQELARRYKVSSTPTIFFIKNNKIDWVTNGISPTLSIRIQNFLSNNLNE